MDQHTIELILAGVTGPAAIAAWNGVGKVAGYVAKRRVDARAKREEAEADVLVIRAQTEQQHQARADEREDTATHRLIVSQDDRIAKLERQNERLEQRVDECDDARERDRVEFERRDRECQEGRLVDGAKIARLEERLERVEGAVDTIPPKAASLIAAQDAKKGTETG